MQGSFKCGHNRTAENSYVSSGTARCMTCHKAAVKKYDTPLSREKKTAADKKRRLENTAKHMIQAHHRANTLKRDATLEEMRGVLSYMERAVTDYEL